MYPDFKLGGKQLNVEKVNLRYLAHYNQIRLVHRARQREIYMNLLGPRREKGEKNRMDDLYKCKFI